MKETDHRTRAAANAMMNRRELLTALLVAPFVKPVPSPTILEDVVAMIAACERDRKYGPVLGVRRIGEMTFTKNF